MKAGWPVIVLLFVNPDKSELDVFFTRIPPYLFIPCNLPQWDGFFIINTLNGPVNWNFLGVGSIQSHTWNLLWLTWIFLGVLGFFSKKVVLMN